ncbi:MAG: type I DNA topoisomerase [Deltaproteobacteria bacterium]|nr:type I DNA topoisomerase [Deltaproteobacteria bacterium]MBW1925132.1 type I DNA topoisomerase [Deltaproteobacteria bacterium]MBW1949229.1 type I DNA topoisomerase [Deltaproteobacteria bacterium]MBW2007204.1 type I DNA topoisomerase [Deltaproteobacteria bacterium]MBW2103556.1 type I DNA topoisomerase [Deltaproteobacteria bacterium]
MAKNLLIVESPAKARTIKKYLGADFQIMASVGHVKDLPVNRLGVDIEKDFEPEYVTIKGKSRVLKNIKSAAKKAEAVYLGPDPDREGEAIAWHIAGEIGNGDKRIHRVLFNELTARAIREAVAVPVELNRHKFESQQARRILDRLVGYQLSPLLWTRVKRGLSAGRVQSVALRMICDREREIQAFEAREYWSLTANLEAHRPPPFKARLVEYDGRKIDLENEAQTLGIASEVEGRPFRVATVSKKKTKRNPPPPFTTSLLQQEAYRKLRFSAKKTMSVAQSLYEGVSLGDEGEVGLITYMRTDSFRLSDEAVSRVREYIPGAFGSEYLPERPNRFRSRKGAQEAHEAIRPTSVDRDPGRVSPYLNKDQLALYTLIWKRFVACQMRPAILDQTRADITSGRALFRATGSVMVFNGFTALYEEGRNGSETAEESEKLLPPLKKGQELKLVSLDPAQHFTQPPPRYTEATLIRALEEKGIGRPSTYAAILANISVREYVSREKRRFKPTELGLLVTDLLVANFPEIMNTAFTARMESNLDRIERGEVKWTRVLRDFYASFRKDLDRAGKEMKGEVPAGIRCPVCGKDMVIKSGRNGLFLACTGYPECRHTANFTRDEKGRVVAEERTETGEEAGTCEACGRPMVVKLGKYGPFLACTGYPECTNTRPLEYEGEPVEGGGETGVRCARCGARMIRKVNRAGQEFLACEKYPECKYTRPMGTGVGCPEEDCGGELVQRRSKRGRVFYACDQYPRCRFVMWDEPQRGECPRCGTRVLSIRKTKSGGSVVVCRKPGCGFKKPLPAS